MRQVAGWLAVAALLASACTPQDTVTTKDPSVQYGNPTPTQVSTTTTPTATPTPTTEELVRQTQAAYQVAFDEFERLSWEGGADEPSPRLLEVAEGKYVEKVMSLLQEQKKTGFRIEGEPSMTSTRSEPGYTSEGSDASLTLLICEDRRTVSVIEKDGRRVPGRLNEGYAFAKRVNGRVKLTDIRTERVEKCS